MPENPLPQSAIPESDISSDVQTKHSESIQLSFGLLRMTVENLFIARAHSASQTEEEAIAQATLEAERSTNRLTRSGVSKKLQFGELGASTFSRSRSWRVQGGVKAATFLLSPLIPR